MLIANGFKEDLKACAELDSTDVIPYFAENVIKVLK